jgi:2,3-bisphosphoglycerate-independent phosphoglycerate mutase
MDLEFLKQLIIPAQTKIAMIILDGLGGLPLTPGGKTELETAHTPNLDALAAQSALGLTVPLGPGITVESGPGHLAIFGYDPIRYRIGRGVLEAVGVEFDLGRDDVATRGNFCAVNDAGVVIDRRAGRIPTDVSKELAKLLATQIEDVEFFVEVVKEHRLAIILRGPDLGAALTGTDPLKSGKLPLSVCALDPSSEKTARVANQFIERARRLLAGRQPANMLLVRGFDRYPNFPVFPKVFGLRAAAIALNPTYRGIAKLVGMQILKVDGSTFADEFAALEKR